MRLFLRSALLRTIVILCSHNSTNMTCRIANLRSTLPICSLSSFLWLRTYYSILLHQHFFNSNFTLWVTVPHCPKTAELNFPPLSPILFRRYNFSSSIVKSPCAPYRIILLWLSNTIFYTHCVIIVRYGENILRSIWGCLSGTILRWMRYKLYAMC